MNHTRSATRLFLMGACAAGALAVAVGASAQPALPGNPEGQAVSRIPPPPPAGQLGGPAGLGLTAEQQPKVRALREQQRTEIATVREQMMSARKELQALGTTPAFDEKATRAAATALAAAQADQIVMRARHRSQLMGLLTPEQQQRLQQRQARMARLARVAEVQRRLQSVQRRLGRFGAGARTGRQPGWGGGQGLRRGGRGMMMDPGMLDPGLRGPQVPPRPRRRI